MFWKNLHTLFYTLEGIDNRLGCASCREIEINDTHERILGICSSESTGDYVGITRIREIDGNQEENYELRRTDSAVEFVDWVFDKKNWNRIDDLSEYEFFDPLSDNPPYQSWVNRPNKSEKYHLGRISLYNGLKEYYLFKFQNGDWSNIVFNPILHELNEERRIIFGLRAKYGNPMRAQYEFRNSVVLLFLYCRLPHDMEVFINTYSWPLKGIQDTCYVIPFKLWDVISDRIEKELCIELKEK